MTELMSRTVPVARPARSLRWAVPVIPALVCGLAMLAVALVHAGRPRLSWDEVTSAEVSARTVPEIWRLIQHVDAVFGAYYTFLHFWSGVFGTTELALRVPSIIAMSAAVALAAELARRLFGPLVALATGAILVIIPNTSRYAAEARPYAFVCFFSMLALCLLIGTLRRPGAAWDRGRVLWWSGYALSVLLLGGFHLVSLTVLSAHAAVALIFAWRRRDWRIVAAWAVAVAVALLPLLPLARLGSRQDAVQLHWVKPITIAGIRAMPADIIGSPQLAWLLIGLAVLATWRPVRRLTPIAVLALGPLVAVALVSALITPMWVARYMLVVLAPTAILAAVALVGEGDTPRRSVFEWPVLRAGAVLVVMAVVAVPGQRAIRTATAKNGPDYRGLVALVERYQGPGDVIAYPPENRAMRAGMEYYFRRYPTAPADVLLEVPAPRTGELTGREYPDDAVRLAGAPGIWLIAANRVADPTAPRPSLRPMLSSHYHRVGLWQVKHATAALYRPVS
ncbi:glycosyltransferase family 39 protein [Actinoplanes sp. NPDC051851]|uniref:glycosyltransferase family 39 protein n=1 Tax=Actinoplanes sp. NPDC051851 TaxID=3154753 RepID=UPI0034157411